MKLKYTWSFKPRLGSGETHSFEMVKFVRQVLHSGLHRHHDVTVAVQIVLSMRSSVLLLLKMILEFLKHSLSTNKTKQAHAVMKRIFVGVMFVLESLKWPCLLTLRVWSDLSTNLESLKWPCLLTLRVWHRQYISSPQTPSGVSPCPPSAVWSVSHCPSVAPQGA